MNRFIAAACVVLSITTPVHSQPRSGWTSYEEVSNAGIPICGVKAEGSPETDIHIKYFLGRNDLIIHLFRIGWSYLPITTLETTLAVDGRQVWTGTSGARMDHTQISINADQADPLLQALARGRTLTITVTDQSPMTIPLRGSNAALNQMTRCVERLFERVPSEPSTPRSRRWTT